MAISVHMFAFNTAIAKELKERIQSLAEGQKDSSFVPSPYQQKIFDFVASGRGSAIVKAVAGSGKTTTCIKSLAYIPGVDLTRVRASTFHSVGFSAICKFLNRTPQQMNVDGSKVVKMLRGRLSEEENEMYGSFVAKLVGFAKGQGFGAITPADERAWLDLISHHDLYLDHADASEERAVELARDALRWSNEVAKSDLIIDFDDQLYLPLLWKLKLWQNDVVYVDESQDTNPTRRALLKLALRPGGRLIAVGDEKQGIYGFTGASHDAMDLIKKEFNCIELPLTVSYRCSKAVVAHAKELVPYIEPHAEAVEGEVVDLKLAEALKVLTSKDAILCRNTAPLISLAFKLLGQGVGCHVLGKEIGKGLTDLIKKQKAKGLTNLEHKLEAYRMREVAKFTAKGEEQKAAAVDDRVVCITTIIDNLHEGERTIPALLEKIDGLFSDANGVLVLSTMHKSKGREWDHVAIFEPGLCPSKWARQDHQVAQEWNLLYVARTRARHSLIYIQN